MYTVITTQLTNSLKLIEKGFDETYSICMELYF